MERTFAARAVAGLVNRCWIGSGFLAVLDAPAGRRRGRVGRARSAGRRAVLRWRLDGVVLQRMASGHRRRDHTLTGAVRFGVVAWWMCWSVFRKDAVAVSSVTGAIGDETRADQVPQGPVGGGAHGSRVGVSPGAPGTVSGGAFPVTALNGALPACEALT